MFGPIINSAGRLGDANKIVKLLSSSNLSIVEKIIKHLISDNEKRKIEKDYFNELDFNDIKKNNNVLVEYKHILSEGIIGIIASKLTIILINQLVLTMGNRYYKASARSTPDFNIGKYIEDAVKKIILSGGGHNLAAGFLLKRIRLKNLKFYK